MAVDLILTPPKRRAHAHAPIPYTGSPLLLCLADIRLFFSLAWSIPGILTPLTQWQGGELDELYPSLPNLYCLTLHAFLILFQSLFLLSLPLLIVLPVWVVAIYLAAVYTVTAYVAHLLNGTTDVLHSAIDVSSAPPHPGERWIYLNGVSVGRHWLQSNLDRLARTFRRPVTGVHNRTYGLLFDLVQCILERDFLYATTDMRRSYAAVKAALLEPATEKVVLILHSQGGIEGGIILDWLLTEVDRACVAKCEIYTFGSAANHFNNPRCAPSAAAVRHIEHYASDAEFVACWGVLYFAKLPNRYAGNLFVRQGTGHLMNQHYLNALFPLGEDGRVMEEEGNWEAVSMAEGEAEVEGAVCGARRRRKGMKSVRDRSRLWAYRDGRAPEE
ncbi:hypothetical protein PMIN06_010115 [Paraphaeosphaeria minitans]|uniref:Alpha/beta-hydrolase n=1 Tax=Paraphaeosphaeria minitans TaxID=565426 RepID=A0A9P6KR16_9PLEO|nr:hypothetical protein PMIN01_05642 [Paraphaeosphaeria minitans]